MINFKTSSSKMNRQCTLTLILAGKILSTKTQMKRSGSFSNYHDSMNTYCEVINNNKVDNHFFRLLPFKGGQFGINIKGKMYQIEGCFLDKEQHELYMAEYKTHLLCPSENNDSLGSPTNWNLSATVPSFHLLYAERKVHQFSLQPKRVWEEQNSDENQ